ncbi:hypothetical protein SAOR_12245 [Salinisphaera orenii MK-B5]|uniref:HTH cro/C1-type domain-containing protein n=1 Tax=Salinisphaera orenii MK-B5 TaxID=856730 RepID=A0A423PI88_9GAMM|nr:helix-turn-helix domain-containing protein [Salinisphaera orenii]ROO25321.1 hypothetical protein SAOR_12245 [Salinisphaera orenii MK-B5]
MSATDGPERGRLSQVTHFTANLSRNAVSALARRVGGMTLEIGRTLILDRAQRRVLSEEQQAWMSRAGEAVRDARRTAGLSRDDLARALDLEDKSLLQAVEQGSATVSFELILRLTSLLARNDPVPFLIQLVRGFNPRLWALAEDWGVGRLPTMVERDRQWMNIYRGNEAARQLPDAAFDEVMAFCESALTMAVAFRQDRPAPSSSSGEAADRSGPTS